MFPRAARKSGPATGGSLVGQLCATCGAQAMAYFHYQFLCTAHLDAKLVKAKAARRVRKAAEAAERRQRAKEARAAARKAARKAARAAARAAAERDAHEALLLGAAEESSESEGGALPGAAPPHALARKTLRLQYALRSASPAVLVAHLSALVNGGNAADLQALAVLLPKARFPPQVRPAAACVTPECAEPRCAQPAELAKCARCRKDFDAAYNADGACRLEHEYEEMNGDRHSGYMLCCSRCKEGVDCDEDGEALHSDGGPCFVGRHTTSQRHVPGRCCACVLRACAALTPPVLQGGQEAPA